MGNALINDDSGLSFSPLATTDIKATWAYLADHGDDVAEDFIRSILRVCGLISQNPGMGRDRSEIIVDLRLFPYKNYNIFYFLTDNGVEIYRVLHSSRDTIQIFDDAIGAN